MRELDDALKGFAFNLHCAWNLEKQAMGAQENQIEAIRQSALKCRETALEYKREIERILDRARR